MKSELAELTEVAQRIGIANGVEAAQDLERYESLNETLDEYDEWLRTGVHLPAEMSRPMFKIWRILRAEMDGVQRGKDAARARFS